MTITDLLHGLIWSTGGLIVGYILGRASRSEAQVSDPVPRSRWRQWAEIARTLSGILLLLLVLVSSIRYYEVTSCQEGYNTAVATRFQQISDAQGVEIAAQIELLTTDNNGDRARARATIDRYVAALRDLERVRTEHPLPAPESCGKTPS